MPRAPQVYRFARRTDDEKARDRKQYHKATDARRGSAHERGYDSRWQAVSAGHLRKRPLCVCCAANGRTTAATLVDHIVPHRGDKVLFWASDNRQGLCANCHSRIKSRLERQWSLGVIDAADLALSRPLPEFFIDVV